MLIVVNTYFGNYHYKCAFILTMWILLCCPRSVVPADVRVCSEYLVSGLHGVNDTALTTSTNHVEPVYNFGARNARLYNPGNDVTKMGSARGSGVTNVNQYIQVTFPVDTIVQSVTVQGRERVADHMVTSYYLLHSMNGVTWTTVTSPDGSPTLFPGSVSRKIHVTSYVTPNITARHLRINPQSWTVRIFLRFDVGGCQVRKLNDGHTHTRFARKSVDLTEDMLNSHVIMPAKKVASLKDCSFACRDEGTCMSFIHQTTKGTQWCTGYNAGTAVPGKISTQKSVFFNMAILAAKGYTEGNGGTISYNVIEVRTDKAGAVVTCTEQGTQLMMVDSASKMTCLQEVIGGNLVLKQNYRLYVSGSYNSQIWVYNGGVDKIDSSLWSPSNPDPTQGHCVMLTQAGLASVDCTQKLFSICGY